MRILLISILALLLIIPLQAQDKKPIQLQHIAYVAAGAPAFYLSVNYEMSIRKVKDFDFYPRVGFGMNFFAPSAGREFNFLTGVTVLYGPKQHKAESGLGIVHDLLPQYNYLTQESSIKYKPILYATLGYRFEALKSGLVAKILFVPSLSLNMDNAIFFPLAELGIGYKF